MNNQIRVFLWLALGAALFFNYTQWQRDYAPAPDPRISNAAPDGSPGAPNPAGLGDNVPQPAQSAATSTIPDSATAAVGTAAPAPAAEKLIRVTTDVFVIEISALGGTLVRAELLGYPVVKGQAAHVVLFNRDLATTNYTLQTGLTGDPGSAPTHLTPFSSTADHYALAPGQDELRVPLSWTDGKGVTITKTFVFHRSMFSIGLEYRVNNASTAQWHAKSYARIERTDPEVERSMFKVESFATRGPAIYAPDGVKYQKLQIDDDDDRKLAIDVKKGWIAGIQHHFVSAVVPDPANAYQITMTASGRQYQLMAVGPDLKVAAGKATTIKESLFVGPKLQSQLETLHPELTRVADYGILTLVSRPLFWLLDKAHGIVRNWGLAIILVTLLLKLLFYPLSEKAGRSMGRMRALAPRLKTLQETYKDDRTKLGQATMDLYRTEKVNPVAGCLPMLIQMPVFLAFYWVLLESVEMRQAPFFGWINDLSSKDPLYILPALNGLAMWAQYKLNPPPPDPVQAKIFQFMPVVFSVMFALFPAGLVLYWVTNTGLSILQQWNINRKIKAEEKSARK